MTKKAYLILTMSVVAVALAVPLLAQSSNLRANIPFDFTVAGKSLPAGEYVIVTDSNPCMLIFRGEQHPASALALVSRETILQSDDPAGITRLGFNKYGDHYYLSTVTNGYADATFALSKSASEREASKTASAAHVEVLAMLAQR